MIAHLPFNKHLFVKLIKVTDAKIDKPWYHVFTGALLGGDLLWSSLRYVPALILVSAPDWVYNLLGSGLGGSGTNAMVLGA